MLPPISSYQFCSLHHANTGLAFNILVSTVLSALHLSSNVLILALVSSSGKTQVCRLRLWYQLSSLHQANAGLPSNILISTLHSPQTHTGLTLNIPKAKQTVQSFDPQTVTAMTCWCSIRQLRSMLKKSFRCVCTCACACLCTCSFVCICVFHCAWMIMFNVFC